MEKSVQTLSRAPAAFSQEDLDEALGNTALEGLHPSPEALEDLKSVVAGQLSVDEYVTRAKARYVGL